MPTPASRPAVSTTTAPTAGLGDTNPTPALAKSSALRMCCSSDGGAAIILQPVLRQRLRSARVEDDPEERCDRRGGRPVRASGGRAVLFERAVFASKKAN